MHACNRCHFLTLHLAVCKHTCNYSCHTLTTSTLPLTPQKEADALRLTKTSSASLIRAHGKGARQLLLTPGSVHFSGLAPAAVAHRTVRLRNVSAEVVRYHVQRPPQPFRVIYKPAPVAPGTCWPCQGPCCAWPACLPACLACRPPWQGYQSSIHC
jgi:hypothetical protein